MEELSVEELLEKYPSYKQQTSHVLFVTETEFKKLKEGQYIFVGDEKLHINYLMEIIRDNKAYELFASYCRKEINSFAIAYIINGDTVSLSRSKNIILKGLLQLLNNNPELFNDDDIKRIEYLKQYISYDNYIDNNRSNKYDIYIEGEHYEIPISDMDEFLKLSDEEFENICKNYENTNYKNIPVRYFVYALYKYIKTNSILNDYLLPDKIEKRFKEIASLQKVDFESVNQYLDTIDTLYKQVKINSELKNAILKDIPSDFNNLQKAIYIYIKMCKIFTYDDEYYAVSQQGPATIKHKSIKHLSTLSLENNRIVCFEFNLLYSLLLNEIGVHFKSDYSELGEADYGNSHSNLTFKCDKYLVFADSVTGILQGDLMQAKLNQPLRGLKCSNQNKDSREEFDETLSKVYELLANQEKEGSFVEYVETFNDIVEQYSLSTDNIQSVDLKEKFDILINKLQSKNLVGIDALSYILQLKKVLFTKEERENNFKVTIIRNNTDLEEGRIAKASAIISLNEKSFNEDMNNTKYFFYSPNQPFREVEKEYVKKYFDTGSFEYITTEDPKIPGIETGGSSR